MFYRSFAAIVFVLMAFAPLQAHTFPSDFSPIHSQPAAATKWIRTELYFGRNKPDGSEVSESDWQKFVDEFVTPRFPDGLTAIDGDGQFRGKDNVIVREKSKILILLYPRKDRKASNARIEEIRTEYKKRFDQESVLRVDLITLVIF